MELPTNVRCSVARSLEVVGQKWSLLVVREALRGHTRFADFRARIGLPSDVLAARLDALVEHGVLERRPYREPGERVREEYVLTAAGRDLLPVVAALAQWGDEHLPTGHGPATVYVERDTGRPVSLAFVDAAGVPVERSRVVVRRGPGASREEGAGRQDR